MTGPPVADNAAARTKAAAQAVREFVRATASNLADFVDLALDEILGPAAPQLWVDALVREGLEGIRALHLAAALFVPILEATARPRA